MRKDDTNYIREIGQQSVHFLHDQYGQHRIHGDPQRRTWRGGKGTDRMSMTLSGSNGRYDSLTRTKDFLNTLLILTAGSIYQPRCPFTKHCWAIYRPFNVSTFIIDISQPVTDISLFESFGHHCWSNCLSCYNFSDIGYHSQIQPKLKMLRMKWVWRGGILNCRKYLFMRLRWGSDWCRKKSYARSRPKSDVE